MTQLDIPTTAPSTAPRSRRIPLAGRSPSSSPSPSPLPVLMCGVFMIVLDFFIVNVALPSMQAELHAGPSAIEWVVAGYGLTFAVFLIAAGRFGDMVGRRRTFAAGLALFVAASAVCGLAPDSTVLVVARLAQGIAAALISPNVLAIIGVAYPGPSRVRAITIYGMVMGVAAAGGQLLGGILIQADLFGWGWRTVFLINIPIGLVALALTRRLVPESRVQRASRFDLGGNGLAILGLTALVLPLVEGTQLHWPVWTWISLGAAPVVFGLFVLHQRRLSRRGGAPLFDPALFWQRALAAGLATQLTFWCGQASFFLVLALYLQKGRGLDALDAGLVFSILALAYLATSFRAPALTLRFGRSLIAVGAVTMAIGDLVLLAVVHGDGLGSIGWLAPGLVLVGLGMGLCITALTTTVLAHADAQRAGAVSSALSTMQQVGNSLGVAVTGVIFFGAVPSGYQRAFELSVAQLALLFLAVAVLTRLLPRPRAAQGDR
ncbi:MAG TPA: MFS transporter [Acidimicrobiales bacterium]